MTPTPERTRKNRGKAIASLVCAVVGFLCYYIFVPFGVMLFPFAICLAVLAMIEMKQQPDSNVAGKCMAITGLIIGIIGFILSIILIVATVMYLYGYNSTTPE